VTTAFATAAPGVTVTGTAADLSARLDAERASGRSVGIVLTMGALHDGHASLIERAASECDVVAVSVFVNPTQFAEPGDLTNYPRTLDADLEIAGRAGADLVFAPSVVEMYPDWPTPAATTVTVRALGDRWEGLSRPGHFDGVATVVAKLLSMAGRCRTYFGEKDFQQLAIVRRVVRDLSLPVEVVGCPTVREADGLAMSSRNVRLAADERSAAVCLSRALRAGADAWAAGSDAATVESAMAGVVATEPLVSLDYAVLVDAADLEPAGTVSGDRGAGDRPLRLLIAAQVGPVRLIDNIDPRNPRTARTTP
jgi:pantoate--beta-alanine ligase